jgi:hypothetical protein
MKFNIYGRCQIDVQREHDAWVAYRSEHGKRSRLNDVVIPADVALDDIATYLDDIFHEYARHGEQVEPIPDSNRNQPAAARKVSIICASSSG